jgi:hypothetical protein
MSRGYQLNSLASGCDPATVSPGKKCRVPDLRLRSTLEDSETLLASPIRTSTALFGSPDKSIFNLRVDPMQPLVSALDSLSVDFNLNL